MEKWTEKTLIRNIICLFLGLGIVVAAGCAATKKVDKSPNQDWQAKKEKILNDKSKIISDDFMVTDSLKHRVSFWFDIYGRYDSKTKVIHDSNYPWIVYEVVDTRSIQKPESFLANRVKYYKKLIKESSRKTKNLSKENKRIKKLLKNFPQYIKKAAKNIRYQTGQKDHMRAGVERSVPYLDYMEEIFTSKGLPVELTRLPFVESSFNWKAHSKAGARGIWQFMIGTGKKFLKINRQIDERISPLKSTVAAAKLLKQNHRILSREWPLAITAYNHGPSGVKKAAKRVGSKDMGVIADNYKSRRFSFASANFYSCFLAALYVEKYKDNIFNDLNYRDVPKVLVEKTRRSIRVRKLFKSTKLSKKDFISWNPDLKKALRKNYRVPRNFTYFKPMKVKNLALSKGIDKEHD